MRDVFARAMVALVLWMTVFVIAHPAKVQAQTVFCPTNFGDGLGTVTLTSGSCTNGFNGAFSGAALAGQALSELSETSTQETTKNVVKSIVERREQERQRCPEGFRRVDGTCEKIPAPVTEAAPPPAAPPPEERVLKKAKKPKAAAVARKEVIAPAPKKVAVAPAAKVVYRAPPPSPPPPLMPVPIEAAVRFGTWTQVYGDYQKRDAAGPGILTCCSGGSPFPGQPLPQLGLSIQSRTGTVGFLAGADLTARDLVFGNDGVIAGVMAGYVSSDLNLNTSAVSITQSAVGTGAARLHANLSGPTAGLYATYFSGPFSTDFSLRFDALTLNQTFNDLLATTGAGGFSAPYCPTCAPPPAFLPFASGGSVGLLNTTINGNLNYRFDLYPNFWVEPTVGALYTNSSYGSGAAQLGLDTGNLVRVQGGARFGITTLLNNILMTTVLTGLAYDDVLVSGGFIPVGAFAGNNLLVQSDQGFVRGLGMVALNFDFGNGVSSFVQGDVYGGAHLIGAGGKAGVRVQW
jgi:hypothetical protein